MNTKSSPSIEDILRRIHEIWRLRAGRDTSVSITVLELIAAKKLALSDPDIASKLNGGELTSDRWRDLQKVVWAKSSHSPGRRSSNDEVQPGLIEEVRRTLDLLDPQLNGRPIRQFIVELVSAISATMDFRSGPVLFGPPTAVLDFLARTVVSDTIGPVYVPNDGSGWLPIHLALAGNKVCSEVRNADLAHMLRLVAFIGDLEVEVREGDMLREPAWIENREPRKFAGSAALLSFGQREVEEAIKDPLSGFPGRLLFREARELAHLVAQTDGVVAAVATEGLLFRTTGGEREFKEWLVRNGCLRAVVRLPRNSFAPATSIQSSILILDTRSRFERITFVDASSDFDRRRLVRQDVDPKMSVSQVLTLLSGRVSCPEVAVVEARDVEAQDFNLSVDRYLKGDTDRAVEDLLTSAPTVSLEDAVDILRPQATGNTSHDAGPHQWGEVALSDVRSDGTVARPKKTVEIGDHALGRVKRQALQIDDVLLSIRGRIGTTALVEKIDDDRDGWIPSQAFVVLRMRKTSPITPRVLARFLGSKLGSAQLRRIATGTTVPSISMNDLRKVRVMLPTEDEAREVEQLSIHATRVRQEIENLERKLIDIERATWPMTFADFLHDEGETA